MYDKVKIHNTHFITINNYLNIAVERNSFLHHILHTCAICCGINTQLICMQK
jgi:hypothetical protein